MQAAKSARTVDRRAFTRACNEAEGCLANEDPNKNELKILQTRINSLMESLSLQDRQIGILQEDDGASDVDKTAEEEACAGYEKRFVTVKARIDAVLAPESSDKLKTFKYPTVVIRKFSGELKDWLPFWTHFRRFHDDKALHTADKLHYLVQSMTGEAKEFIDAFVLDANNYPEIIKALKQKYGDEKLLAEYFIREMIKIMLTNANNKERDKLGPIVNQIEAKVRSLESMKATCEKCGNLIFVPMIESCLPTRILDLWQHHPLVGGKSTLAELMEFLRSEVVNEQKMQLAKDSLQSSTSATVKKSVKKSEVMREESHEVLPSASALSRQSDGRDCSLCGKSGHDAASCHSAYKMSFAERKKKLQQAGVCFRCLKPNHRINKCKSSLYCQLCGAKDHHMMLCPEMPNPKSEKSHSEDKKSEKSGGRQEGGKTTQMLSAGGYPSVQLKTLLLRIKNRKGKWTKIRAMIDSGSQWSCITKKRAAELGLEKKDRLKLKHTLFGGVQTEEVDHGVYDIHLSDIDGTFFCNFDSLDQDMICGKVSKVPSGPWIEELASLNVEIPDLKSSSLAVDLLIGQDVCDKLLTGVSVQLKCGLTATETKLGWVLAGKVPKKEIEDGNVASMLVLSRLSDASMKNLWDLELLGIREPTESLSKDEKNEAAKDHFRSNVRVDANGRYEVKLPFKIPKTELVDNKDMAKKRLESTMAKLKKMDLTEKYGSIFRDWEAEGIIERVPEDELNQPAYYMPHRPVVKESSATTKIRPVFDASAKTKSKLSLNDILEPGPNLLEVIPAVLMEFREHRYGVISDIGKAFLQIGIDSEDRDGLRFLWLEGGKEFVFRHARLVFGVTCSPFLLIAVIEMILKEDCMNPGLAEKLWRSMYVDNSVTSVSEVSKLLEFKTYAVRVLGRAKMELRLWESSCRSVNLGEEDERVETSVLGLTWNKVEDTIKLKVDLKDVKEVVTKRTLLSMVQKVFDPLGIVSPVMLTPKKILQRTWVQKLGWDEALKPEDQAEFAKWMVGARAINEVKIPRWMAIEERDKSDWSLHIFTDASKDAYGAVVYLRCTTEEQVSVRLLMAKSRVAPLAKEVTKKVDGESVKVMKSITIPRSELLGAGVGCRLAKTIIDALKLDNVPKYFWTDSEVVLAWIKRDESWGTFVGNRVKEIRKLSKVEEWRHVPGVKNPADIPSRGCTAVELPKLPWLEGPDWLKGPSEEWPSKVVKPDESEVAAEKKKPVLMCHLKTDPAEMDQLLKKLLERYSSYSKLLRAVACLLRLENKKRGAIEAAEIDEAEKRLLKWVQKDSGQNEFSFKNAKCMKDDRGLVRVETKILRREDLECFRRPILLPKGHLIETLIIRSLHYKMNHAGVQTLMTSLREKFWIPSSRNACKKIVGKCMTCRRFTSKPFDADTCPLPLNRVKNAAVFEVTGMDLAGPMFLRDKSKVWVCLFTCAVTRAVHFELLTSLSTENFLMGYSRFISRRGRPAFVYSDHGKNFEGADALLKSLDWDRIKKETGIDRVDWRMIPPGSPWWGGFWERLVKELKKLLVRCLGHAVLDYEELTTLLCEVESTINDRPLTYVSEDDDDLLPLTPACFLKELRSSEKPGLNELDANAFRGRFAHRQKVRQAFWDRFRSEYLGLLVQKASNKKTKFRPVKVGEVVLIGHENQKRLFWPLGKVVKVCPGADGVVRVVKVRKNKDVTVERDVRKIYPLEVGAAAELPDELVEAEESNVPEEVELPLEKVEKRSRYGRLIKPTKVFSA